MEDHYKILGVERNASADDIKKAYRRLAKTHHPDVGGNEDEFKKISTAYEILSDEEKKRIYDSGGNPYGGGGHGFDPFEMANRMREAYGFNPFGNRQQKGRDLRFELNLTLEEIYRGTTKKLRFNHSVMCEPCVGTGGKESICDGCGGNGFIQQMIQTPMGRMVNQQICGKCRGAGRVIIEPCKVCNGAASVIKTDTVELRIPEGVENGHTFLVQGGGDYARNAPSGDLYVVINELPNTNMQRQGNDIIKKITLSYIDFILGNDYILDTFDGKIKINIPELSEVNDNLRIRGKGFKRNGSVGDMIVVLQLELPKKISEKEKELLLEIKKTK